MKDKKIKNQKIEEIDLRRYDDLVPEDLKQDLLRFFEYHKITYMYGFYIDLIGRIGFFKTSNVKKQVLSYIHNITIRTIKNRLKKLESLGLVNFSFKKKHFGRIKLHDYENTKAYENYRKTYQKQQENPTNPLNYERFYFDAKHIINKIAKNSNKLDLCMIDKNGANYQLKIPTRESIERMKNIERVIIEASPKTMPNFIKSITYEDLTQRQLPKATCTYLKAIIKARMKDSLNELFNQQKAI